jgi:threonine synthase
LLIYNSVILEYQGSGAAALDWAHECCQQLGIFETSTYRKANPYQAEGPKTIAYEILEQLGMTPDWVTVPVGGGGTLSGIWRGFAELRAQGLLTKLPRMAGVLPTGYTMLQTALEKAIDSEAGLRALTLVDPPQTIQTKIAMALPPDGLEAIAAVRDSGGMFLYASDAEVLSAQKKLGASQGIYGEPSSLASLCGVEQLRCRGLIARGETVVAVITGSGFRESLPSCSSLRAAKTAVDSRSGMAVLEELLRP